LPLFLLRQYDEAHEFFRNDLPVLAGPYHLWAEEVAGDRATGRQMDERVPAGFERVQGPDRAGNLESGDRKSKAKDSASQPAAGGNGQPHAECRAQRAFPSRSASGRGKGGGNQPGPGGGNPATSDDEPLFAKASADTPAAATEATRITEAVTASTSQESHV